MTTMKKSTTCGRREMRALMRAREVNVATPETRARYAVTAEGKAVKIDPASRKTRDLGTAAWGKHLTDAAQSLPRKIRRTLSGVRKVSAMETLETAEMILRAKGTR